MSNLKSAKDALIAEIEHVRQGLEFYQSRIQALEQALATLSSLDGVETAGAKGKRGRKSAVGEAGDTAGPKKRASKRSDTSLPATGKEFWMGLITSEPQSAREVLEAAVKALGISPSKDELKKLAQRQANALHMLIKDKAISDTGTGRDRRFLR